MNWELILKKKKWGLLTKEQQESHENANICFVCKEKFEKKCLKDKKYCEVHFHYTGEHRSVLRSICNLKCSVPEKFL